MNLKTMDTLRAIATVSVIILHVSAPIVLNSPLASKSWMIAHFFDSMVRFCVPVFFMLTGALLLNKDYELNDFLKKRFVRIIPPLVFWSLVYIFFGVFIFGDGNVSFVDLMSKIIRNLLHGSKFHLWFVYTLLGLYLFVPILRKWLKNAKVTDIYYFLIIWLFTIIYEIPWLKDYLPAIDLINFTGYLGYLVLGYFLSKFNKISLNFSVLLFVIGTGITFFGTIYLSQISGRFMDYFYGYLTPNVLCSSIGVFMFFKFFELRNERVNHVILFISNHGYGIYLVHVLFLMILRSLGFTLDSFQPIIFISIMTVSCLTLSSVTIYLMRKIKYASYISG